MTERRSTHLPNMLTGFDVELAIERETDNWGVASVRRSEQCLTLVHLSHYHIKQSQEPENVRHKSTHTIILARLLFLSSLGPPCRNGVENYESRT